MVKLIFIVILAILLGFFAAQNPGLVAVRFLFWQSSAMPLAFVIILAAAGGALFALLASLPIHHRRGRELAKHRREIQVLRGESDE